MTLNLGWPDIFSGLEWGYAFFIRKLRKWCHILPAVCVINVAYSLPRLMNRKSHPTCWWGGEAVLQPVHKESARDAAGGAGKGQDSTRNAARTASILSSQNPPRRQLCRWTSGFIALSSEREHSTENGAWGAGSPLGCARETAIGFGPLVERYRGESKEGELGLDWHWQKTGTSLWFTVSMVYLHRGQSSAEKEL